MPIQISHIIITAEVYIISKYQTKTKANKCLFCNKYLKGAKMNHVTIADQSSGYFKSHYLIDNCVPFTSCQRKLHLQTKLLRHVSSIIT